MAILYNNGQVVKPNTDASLVQLESGISVQSYVNSGGGGGGSTPTPTVTTYSHYTAIGDSITYGSHAGGRSYADNISEMLNITTYSKLAVSGRTIYGGNSSDFLGQCGDTNSNSDLITIMMGVNDRGVISSGSETLGDISSVIGLTYTHGVSYADTIAADKAAKETETSEWDTMLGSFRFGLEYLKNKCPNARVIVITPIYRHFEGSNASTYKALLESIRSSEAVIAQFCGAECFQIVKEPFYGEYFAPFLDDKIHPTSAGQQLLTKRIYQYIVYGT